MTTIMDEISAHNAAVGDEIAKQASDMRTRSALTSAKLVAARDFLRETLEQVTKHLDAVNEELRDDFLRDAVALDTLSQTVAAGTRLAPMPKAAMLADLPAPAEPDDAEVAAMAAKLAPVPQEQRAAA